jgi:NAD(P)-dependent dehydrogenase (short-subunit alcohol dehydrogenase family)
MSFNSPPPLEFTSKRLQDRVVFITGASSGIGAAAARLFAVEGARVVLAARREEQLAMLSAEIQWMGSEALAVVCDVTDEKSVAAAIDATLARFGRLDGAFNNAGIYPAFAPIHEIDLDIFDATIATNLRGVLVCMKHEARAMLANGGGAIVNTSSIGGLVGGANNAIYASSKWGLAGLTKCAALDYAHQGIRVNAIAPGPTRTEMLDSWVPTEEARAAMAGLFPMNYIAHPDDMARAALFLLTDEARWTTGTILPCEGGASAA